ncbi:MAG: PIN domain-containing protein [Gammaproteobacteria bacterium]|nr:PIN domain-containing protein [Gammaproteobacteria bacterium]
MVLTDTGYWLALANPRDKYHHAALEVSKTIDSGLVITWPVITETCHLLGTRVSRLAPVKFLNQVEQLTDLYTLSVENISRIKFLMEKYRDLPMDLADATLVIAAEELGEGYILSTDRRDFKTYRWKNHKPFKNLLFPDD